MRMNKIAQPLGNPALRFPAKPGHLQRECALCVKARSLASSLKALTHSRQRSSRAWLDALDHVLS
jgi:hypothetical protein